MDLQEELKQNLIKEIKNIKWVLSIIAVALVIIAMTNITNINIEKKTYGLMNKTMPTLNPKNDTTSLYYQGAKLIKESNYQGVLDLTNEREKIEPNNPYIYYYRGLTFYYLRNYDRAIIEFEKAQELAPTWEKDYTSSYIQAAKTMLKNRKKDTLNERPGT